MEAQEVSILKAWPFEGYCVDVFNIENQPPHGEPSILPQLLALLAPHGYEHLLRIGVDEVFRRRTPCPVAYGNGARKGPRRGRGAKLRKLEEAPPDAVEASGGRPRPNRRRMTSSGQPRRRATARDAADASDGS